MVTLQDSNIFFASTSTEVTAAYEILSNSDTGGRIILSNDFDSQAILSISEGGAAPVEITSEDTQNEVEIGRIVISNAENISFSHIHIDSSGLSVPVGQGDVHVHQSSNISFDQMTFTSDGTMYFDPRLDSSVDGGRAITATESAGVSVSTSSISNYFQALTFLESSEIAVSGNDIFHIQGDGIKLSQVNDVLVEGNTLRDFATSPNEVNHSDFIQLHSGGLAQQTSTDIEIKRNILDTGNGSSVQGIWMRNEAYNGSNPEMLYQNITITDNIIYTGSANGIGLGASRNSVISNNTLLWNPAAFTQKITGETSFEPKIRIDDEAEQVEITDNITPQVLVEGSNGISESGNIIVSYNSTDANYVDLHFTDVNVREFGGTSNCPG